jgi:hypothetical protein
MLSHRTRIATILATGAATLGLGLSTVSAQNCFVTNRSVQGAYGAAHSSRWGLFDLNAFLAGLGVCPAAISAVDTAITSNGWPLVLVSRTDKTLPDNGHGIQHLEDPGGYFDTVISVGTAAVAAGVCG